MYNERQLEEMLAVLLSRCRSINESYIIAMADQIRDIGQLIPSGVNRLVQYQRMNANLDGIMAEMARLAEISVEDLQKIFEEAAKLDMRFAADRFSNAYRPSLMELPGLKQILTAQLNITGGAMANLSQTRVDSELYKNAVDAAISAVQTGVSDYDSAIRRALGEAAAGGVRITDSRGRKMRLDSAVRRNVLDGIRALNNDVLRQAGEQFGADGVEISAHMLCAEDHLPYQGRQYSLKAFADLQERLKRPFGMWNCRHSMHPILLGVSEPAYSDEQLLEFEQNSREAITIDGETKSRYEWTQEQRRLETAIRRQKDVAAAYRRSGDMAGRRSVQAVIDALMERYGTVSEKAQLRPDYSRTRVDGYSYVKPKPKTTSKTT